VAWALPVILCTISKEVQRESITDLMRLIKITNSCIRIEHWTSSSVSDKESTYSDWFKSTALHSTWSAQRRRLSIYLSAFIRELNDDSSPVQSIHHYRRCHRLDGLLLARMTIPRSPLLVVPGRSYLPDWKQLLKTRTAVTNHLRPWRGSTRLPSYYGDEINDDCVNLYQLKSLLCCTSVANLIIDINEISV